MNKKYNWKNISITLFIISIVYIILIKTIDVKPIGPEETKVGFAALNNFFHQLCPMNEGWYKATKYIGVIPFLFVVYYGLIGVLQLVHKKSLAKVDKRIIILGIFYILVGATYLFFEKIIINYRPVLLDGELEASFPSSHTMLAICVCASSLLMSKYYIKDKRIENGLYIFTWVLMIVLIVGRILSGVHWITDIIGGIIISLTLISLLIRSLNSLPQKK